MELPLLKTSILVGLFSLTGCVQLATDTGDAPPRGPVAAADLEGQRLSLGSGRQLLVFWQTSCSSCKRHNPEVVALAERRTDLEVIGICCSKDAAQEVAATADAWGMPFANVHDPDLVISRRFKISGTPTLLLFDHGREVYRGHRLPDDFDALLSFLPPVRCGDCDGEGCPACEETPSCENGVCTLAPGLLAEE